MKFLNIKMIALAALLSITGYSFGYDFHISNKTKQPVIIRLKVRGGGQQFNLIKPNKRTKFVFAGGDIGLCLESIHWAPYDATDKYQGNNQYKGKNLMEIMETGADLHNAGPAHDAFYALIEDYALTSVPMKMLPGDVYEATGKAATALVSGIDDLACKITDIALAASTGGASEAAKVVAALASSDKKEATDSKKEAAKAVGEAKADPTKKPEADAAIANAQNKDKIVALGTLEVTVGSSIIDDNTFEYITKAVPTVIAAIEKAKTLFDDPSYTKIKALFDSGKNEDGLTAIETFRKGLEKMSTTKASIDDEAMVYGCSTCNINTNVDTNLTKKSCSFGIGEIAGSISELMGTSVCKNREFLLLPGKEGGKDEIIAVTRKGE